MRATDSLVFSALCRHSPDVGGDGLPDVKESSQARWLGPNSNTRGVRDAMSKAELPTCHGSLVDAPARTPLSRRPPTTRVDERAPSRRFSIWAAKPERAWRSLPDHCKAGSHSPCKRLLAKPTSPIRPPRWAHHADALPARPNPPAPESARQASSRRSARATRRALKNNGRRLRRRPRLPG